MKTIHSTVATHCSSLIVLAFFNSSVIAEQKEQLSISPLNKQIENLTMELQTMQQQISTLITALNLISYTKSKDTLVEYTHTRGGRNKPHIKQKCKFNSHWNSKIALINRNSKAFSFSFFVFGNHHHDLHFTNTLSTHQRKDSIEAMTFPKRRKGLRE